MLKYLGTIYIGTDRQKAAAHIAKADKRKRIITNREAKIRKYIDPVSRVTKKITELGNGG